MHAVVHKFLRWRELRNTELINLVNCSGRRILKVCDDDLLLKWQNIWHYSSSHLIKTLIKARRFGDWNLSPSSGKKHLPCWAESINRQSGITERKNQRNRKITYLCATFPTTNPTRTEPCANPGLRVERPSAKSLSNGKAFLVFYVTPGFHHRRKCSHWVLYWTTWIQSMP
jgi:hypothetical protein